MMEQLMHYSLPSPTLVYAVSLLAVLALALLLVSWWGEGE